VCARMAGPTSFAHGAALLSKDVRLLGEVTGPSNVSYIQLRDAARSFIDLALGGGVA
jgi:3-hydroxyisobutyrate dehydrogenase